MDLYQNNTPCPCGKPHGKVSCEVLTGSGALKKLPELMERLEGKHAFILADKNTYTAAGMQVETVLKNSGKPYSTYVFNKDSLEPDEWATGSAFMHLDSSADIIIGVGSGVINDICKILSATSNKKYIIVATAPSMDGYASASSSMTRDGLKISLPSRCADAIVGDTDILKNAPLHMLRSGIGDMLAKYISIAEWRIAHIITGEYYCESIADLVRKALKKCVDNADGLLKRDEQAVEAVFEGLIIGGVAMAYAGVSRPASGVEHYFSHVWDMRGCELGTPVDLHGIQCGVGTLYAARIYDQIRGITPNKEKALAYVESFDLEKYNTALREYIGSGAETMIEAEKKDGKYNKEKHKARLDTICEHWDEIQGIISEEIPTAREIEKLLDTIEAPKSCADFGLSEKDNKRTFEATKDIRDKYVLSRLCFDLGILDEI